MPYEGGPVAALAHTRTDPAMVKAPARARRRKRMPEKGRFALIGEMAAAGRIDRGLSLCWVINPEDGRFVIEYVLSLPIKERVRSGLKPTRFGQMVADEPHGKSAHGKRQRQQKKQCKQTPLQLALIRVFPSPQKTRF